MKNKFKIKVTCKDGVVCVESYGTNEDLLIGLRCIIKSLSTEADIPGMLIMAIVKDAIEEAAYRA